MKKVVYVQLWLNWDNEHRPYPGGTIRYATKEIAERYTALLRFIPSSKEDVEAGFCSVPLQLLETDDISEEEYEKIVADEARFLRYEKENLPLTIGTFGMEIGWPEIGEDESRVASFLQSNRKGN